MFGVENIVLSSRLVHKAMVPSRDKEPLWSGVVHGVLCSRHMVWSASKAIRVEEHGNACNTVLSAIRLAEATAEVGL